MLAASVCARSQMQSVMLVRSHHKHTHLVAHSLPDGVYLQLSLIQSCIVTPEQRVAARTAGRTLCRSLPGDPFEKVLNYIVSDIDLGLD